MPKARRSGADRRAQIAQAALECLIQHGYAGLTARRVAAQAGISLGHLTYHFTTMEAVLVQAYHLAAAQLRQCAPLGDLVGLTPTQRLARYLQSVYAPQTLTPQLLRLRIDLWSAARHSPAIAAIETTLAEDRRAQIEGYLTAISDPYKLGRVPAVLRFVTATMDGLWLDYLRDGDIEAIDAAIDACALFVKMRLGGT